MECAMPLQMTRKSFCKSLLGSTALLLIQSCGGGGSDAGLGANPPSMPAGGSGCTDTIAGNHGHVLTIALADLDSATDMVYNIQGSATHNHTVTLSVAELRSLKTGATVSTTSSVTDAHQHDITVTCL